MFDRDEFDRRINPKFGYGALPLERAFDYVRDAGWRPRRSRASAELFKTPVIGDCLHPIVRLGDELLVDCDTRARSGDIAFFRLSFRGAAALNAVLKAGQAPWQAGQFSAKLLVNSRGRDLLLERFGGCAPATLLASDSDDEAPDLSPVTNVRRAGKLLFSQE